MPATTITQSASRRAGSDREQAVEAGHAAVLVQRRRACRTARRGCAPRAPRARPRCPPRRSRRGPRRERRDGDPGAARALVLQRAGVDAAHGRARGLVGARHEHASSRRRRAARARWPRSRRASCPPPAPPREPPAARRARGRPSRSRGRRSSRADGPRARGERRALRDLGGGAHDERSEPVDAELLEPEQRHADVDRRRPRGRARRSRRVPTPPTSWRKPPRLMAKPRVRTRSSSASSRSRLGIEAAVGRGSGLGSSARTRSNGSSASCERPPETQCAGARWPIVPTERTGFGGRHLLDVDHIGALEHRQLHRLAGLVAQRLHRGERLAADVEARVHARREQQAARPEAVRRILVLHDESARLQRAREPERRGLRAAGAVGELGRAERPVRASSSSRRSARSTEERRGSLGCRHGARIARSGVRHLFIIPERGDQDTSA